MKMKWDGNRFIVENEEADGYFKLDDKGERWAVIFEGKKEILSRDEFLAAIVAHKYPFINEIADSLSD